MTLLGARAALALVTQTCLERARPQCNQLGGLPSLVSSAPLTLTLFAGSVYGHGSASGPHRTRSRLERDHSAEYDDYSDSGVPMYHNQQPLPGGGVGGSSRHMGDHYSSSHHGMAHQGGHQGHHSQDHRHLSSRGPHGHPMADHHGMSHHRHPGHQGHQDYDDDYRGHRASSRRALNAL